jgi:hypothetical protein
VIALGFILGVFRFD